MAKLLSTGDVLGLTGLPAKTFDEWNSKGIVVPKEGGEGHGSHRKFTWMQVLGILVAVELRNGERGCVLPYVGKVVAAFAAMDEKELQAAFKKGATHFLTLAGNRPYLEGPRCSDMVNVQQIYRSVILHIQEMEGRI